MDLVGKRPTLQTVKTQGPGTDARGTPKPTSKPTSNPTALTKTPSSPTSTTFTPTTPAVTFTQAPPTDQVEQTPGKGTKGLQTSPTASSAVGSGRTAFDLRLGGAALASGLAHPAFEHALDKTTGSKARPDNIVTPLFDGQQSFAERNTLIDGASSSIHLQTFIYNDDDTGQDLTRRLCAAAKRGVDVRVIFDGLGSNRSDVSMFDTLRAAGVQVRSHETGLDLLSVNNRWHEKHLVVDGKVAVEGGMNIADEYALGGSGRMVIRDAGKSEHAWRDVDVRVEGPAVHDVQRAFVRNWNLLGISLPSEAVAALFPKPHQAPGGASVRVVQHHPHGDPPDDHTLQLHLQAIGAATKSITVENAYFVPPEPMRKAFVEAAKRGVEVKVLTNSKASSDMGFVCDAARYFYDELVGAGVQIFEQQQGTLHAKTASFDGVYSIVGSCNLNGRSDGRDTEAVVAIRDDATAAALEDRFATGLYNATPVTEADLRNNSYLGDVKQWALSTLAWTI